MIFGDLFRKKILKENEELFSFSVFFNEKFGNYLADKYGCSLYSFEEFNVEKKEKVSSGDELEKIHLGIWQIFYEKNIIVPLSLKRKDFSNIERPDGLMQTTYKGHPLYYYRNDLYPRDVKGEGVNGEWFVVRIKSDF
ncbi:MAG: hypothetical protein WC671_02685 [Candidatus Paceibacterota bacterium]|jgi:predicted lipoprotein with Yx(FWY)xxD motif